MNQDRGGMTVREFAASVGIRMATAYGLLWDGIVDGTKDENGAWVVDRESVEKYRLRRSLRRLDSRNVMRRGAIDVTTAGVHARTGA